MGHSGAYIFRLVAFASVCDQFVNTGNGLKAKSAVVNVFWQVPGECPPGYNIMKQVPRVQQATPIQDFQITNASKLHLYE